MWPPTYFWSVDAEGNPLASSRSAKLYVCACIERVMLQQGVRRFLPFGEMSGVKELLLITRNPGLCFYALEQMKESRHKHLRQQMLKIHAQRISIILAQARRQALGGPPVQVARCPKLIGYGMNAHFPWEITSLEGESLVDAIKKLKGHPAYLGT